MNNKYFKYLMSNDPDKVISEKGIKIRQKINPAFNFILKLINPYKLKIERRANIPNDKPTIFVASHGFRDDIINSVLTLKQSVYILFGVLDQFYKTFDGIKLWISGTILVDREDKIIRAASKPKMVKALSLGANTMDFFEASWNLSDNLLVAKPHIGVYDIAEASKTEVAPITTHVEKRIFRSRVHSILGEPFDITELTEEKALKIIEMMVINLTKASDMFLYDDPFSIYIRSQITDLIRLINDTINSDPDLDILSNLIELVSEESSKIRRFLEKKVKDPAINEIEESIINRSIDLLRVVMYAKKIVSVNELRDIIASHKYELMEKYTNFSNTPRAKLEKFKSLEQQELERILIKFLKT